MKRDEYSRGFYEIPFYSGRAPRNAIGRERRTLSPLLLLFIIITYALFFVTCAGFRRSARAYTHALVFLHIDIGWLVYVCAVNDLEP